MVESADELNRRIGMQSEHMPPEQEPGAVKRRTWEGYADDYRALSERLVEMSGLHQELLDVQKGLQQQLAEKSREIARLKQRRGKDLDRLAEIGRDRDLLERRSSAQMAKVAAALAKVTDLEKQVAATAVHAPRHVPEAVPESSLANVPEAVAYSTRHILTRNRAKTGNGGWWLGASNRWWKSAIRQAQDAHRAGRLADAQVFLEAAILSRENASLWRKLGHVLREQNYFRDAEQAYERALDMEPGHGETLFLAGYCAEMEGNRAHAIGRYRAALERDPTLIGRYDHLRDFEDRLTD